MKVRIYRFLFFIVLLGIFFPSSLRAGSFVAYSLREAERRMKSPEEKSAELTEIGGVTQIAGMVYDERDKDMIIVGQVNKGNAKITLDDFVVAMRSVLLHNEYPLVSIDRTEDTPKTSKQIVRFKGKVENTQFGKDMLVADIILKKLSLGLLPSEPYCIQSYFSMSLDQVKRALAESLNVLPLVKVEDTKYFFSIPTVQLQQAILDSFGGLEPSESGQVKGQQVLADYFRIASRFWFFPLNPSLAVREGVFVIQNLDIGVETEVLYAIIDGKPENDLSKIRDEIGDKFSTQMVANFGKIRKAYLELGNIKTLLDLVALAKGIKELRANPDLSYWLNNYKVEYVFTDTTCDLIVGICKIKGPDGRQQFLEISGGIELNPNVLWLKAGDVTVLKEAVLNAKPKKPNVLTWQVPLEGWEIPGAGKYYDIPKEDSSRLQQKAGFSLDVKVVTTGTSQYNTEELLMHHLNPPAGNMPNFKINGVYIAPVPKTEGREQTGLWENFLKNVLMSRPSQDTLFWEIKKIPETEE